MKPIEETIISHLNANLPVPAYPEIPEWAPAEFVVVEKTGSGSSENLNSSTIVVQSYGASMLEVIRINAKVKSAMVELICLDEIIHVGLNSDYNYTDTASKRRRYQAVFDIEHY